MSNETIADIIKDIRSRNEGVPMDAEGSHPLVEDMLALADRIERAVTNCNQFKMREALLTARSAINDFSHSGLIDTDTYKAEIEQIDAALALPRRNCDVGTAEEQVERFRKLCISMHDNVHHCKQCPLEGVSAICEFKWSQMPYEEEDESEVKE